MTSIRVTPVQSARVRNPARDFAVLPEAGDVVPDTLFWRRRERAGEVVIGDPADAPAPSSPASAEPAETDDTAS